MNTLDSLGLYEIYDYSYVPFWHTQLFKSSIALLLLLVGGYLIYRVIMYMRARRAHNLWTLWRNRLERIPDSAAAHVVYTTLSSLCKECMITKLQAPTGITDEELAQQVRQVTVLSEPLKMRLTETLNRATQYKFNPQHHDATSVQEDRAIVGELLHVLQQREQNNTTQGRARS